MERHRKSSQRLHTSKMRQLSQKLRVCINLRISGSIILILPLAMAPLGAEIELRLAPQLDLVLTAAGIGAMWVWLAEGPSPLV